MPHNNFPFINFLIINSFHDNILIISSNCLPDADCLLTEYDVVANNLLETLVGSVFNGHSVEVRINSDRRQFECLKVHFQN